jgi:hypothetical protein
VLVKNDLLGLAWVRNTVQKDSTWIPQMAMFAESSLPQKQQVIESHWILNPKFVVDLP